jgi:hypothetical protein
MTLSISKKRASGILFSRKVWRPLRGEVGRNQDAQTAMVLGEVEIFEGGECFRASASSLGATRYEEKLRQEIDLNWELEKIAGRRREKAERERRVAVAMACDRISYRANMKG